jgi:hypothetical protein
LQTCSQNRWVAIRFVTARYFETTESFQQGFKEAFCFNVMRRPDNDQNNKSVWDGGKMIVGITRTRASFWYRSADSQKTGESQETGEGQETGGSQKTGESQKKAAVGKNYALWEGCSSADLLNRQLSYYSTQQ